MRISVTTRTAPTRCRLSGCAVCWRERRRPGGLRDPHRLVRRLHARGAARAHSWPATPWSLGAAGERNRAVGPVLLLGAVCRDLAASGAVARLARADRV